MAGQSIRRSQFITTYGPGAILEGPAGPRIIPTLSNGEIFDRQSLSDFEITDRRLSRALLDGASIVRLPSNAELGRPDGTWVYKTVRFPKWSLCIRHGILYRKQHNDNYACPQCAPLSDRKKAWNQASAQAIRFVRACPEGHIDDVDWKGIISHVGDGCNPSYLIWRGGGGALRNVSIVCPACGGSANLGIAYSHEWPCSGKYPEVSSSPQPCSHRSRIFQRGASNLYFPELRTALTIPPRSTALHRMLELDRIRAMLVTNVPVNKEALMSALRRLQSAQLLSSAVVEEIDKYPEDILMDCVLQVIDEDDVPDNESALRLQELYALRHAAQHGYPSQQSTSSAGPPQFEVIKSMISIYTIGNLKLRVTPVNRLRVVMVQTGYRRLEVTNEPVPRPLVDQLGTSWYPGVELFGEGIFVDFPPDESVQLDGPAVARWRNAYEDPEAWGWGTQFPLSDPDYLNPVFIWWHSLSHRLINGLSIDSGYSSAAVRERVLIDPETGTGGVLLYAAQPGGDGTLGGLVALSTQFDRVLKRALGDVHNCSNDPLCGDSQLEPGDCNGAACYSCMLVSETSCEHRNMHLDRNLLMENLV